MSDDDNLGIFADEGNDHNPEIDSLNDLPQDNEEEEEDYNNGISDIDIDDDQLNLLLKDDEEQPESKRRARDPIKKRKSSSGEGSDVRQPRRTSSKREEDQKKIKENIAKEVSEIKGLMEKIHQRDVKAAKEGKPALNKIKNVDEIIVKLSKKEFIQDKGLDYLTNWLDRIPNGPEPSVSLRKKLLQFIYELPVQRQHFQGIRLGKVIYKISSKSEVKELRVLANKVVEKWSKILNTRVRIDDEYNDDENQ